MDKNARGVRKLKLKGGRSKPAPKEVLFDDDARRWVPLRVVLAVHHFLLVACALVTESFLRGSPSASRKRKRLLD